MDTLRRRRGVGAVKTVLAALVGGIAIGAGVAWLVRSPERVEDALSRTSLDGRVRTAANALAQDAGELERLRTELALERDMRERLAEQIANLEAELLGDGGPGGESMPDSETATTTDPADPAGRDSKARLGARRWFDPATLEALGYPPGEIDRIREGWETSVMLRLELEDARTRAGERGMRPVMRDELIVLKRTRDDLGDDAYDAMLYAAGENNRVVLSDVIEDAPAALAGVQPGDEVISYDGERVFYPRELKRLTGEGDRGRPVELRVVRDGELIRLFLPRGPLGAQLARVPRPPVR